MKQISCLWQRIRYGEVNGLRRRIRGRENLFRADGAALTNIQVDLIGDDNQVVIGEGCVLHNVIFRIRGNGHRIEIGPRCRISRGAVIWFEDENCRLQIGEDATMVEVHIAVTEPGSQVHIGKGCMFANDIDIRTGDSHAILDARSGKRLNPAADVEIGDHVWIAAHVIVLKGVTIGENSVVATGSVFTQSCPSGVIVAGNPARVIKTGITWQRERYPNQKERPDTS